MMRPDRWDGIVLAVLAGYFALQAALRIALGGALEVDEAEMIVVARDWRLGYGPQLPLYNWLQAAAFRLFGFGTAGLAIPKNAVLWLAAAGLYLGLRQVFPVRVALAGMLSLALLPNVVWEFQRASTHSIALLAATTWTIAGFLAVIGKGRWRDWLWLGVVMGLGGLCKANYWLVPLALGFVAIVFPAQGQPRLRLGGILAGLAVAGVIVAAPYAWAVLNPDLTLASTTKFYRADSGWPPGVEGLSEAVIGSVAGLLLIALAAGLLRLAGQGGAAEHDDWAGLLLIRAGALALVLSCLGILLGGVSEVQSRWLVPAYVMIGAGVMVTAARRASVRALRWLTGVAVGIGLLTLGGMAELRSNGRTTGRIDFAPLAALTDRLAPDLVVSGFQIGGNLRLLRPGIEVRTPEEPGALRGRVMHIRMAQGAEAAQAAGQGKAGRIDLPYLNGATPPFSLEWRIGAGF
jgi:hypothetical protein